MTMKSFLNKYASPNNLNGSRKATFVSDHIRLTHDECNYVPRTLEDCDSDSKAQRPRTFETFVNDADFLCVMKLQLSHGIVQD